VNSTIRQLPELQQRIIAGVIGVTIILTLIIWSEWGYFLIFGFICVMTLLEFYKLIGLDGYLPLTRYGTFIVLLLYVLTFLIERKTLDTKYYHLLFLGFSFAYLIKLYKKRDTQPFKNLGFTFLGILYVGLPFALLNLAIFFNGEYHYEIIMGSLFILWANDTGAYFAGKHFGKRKLFARISPKKTWEGSLGGLLSSVSISQIMAYYFDTLNPMQWVAISVIIVVSGTYGDLVESLFKRSMAIKDSGTSIPGHGGFLDRFDSLLIASPFIVAFVRMFN
jgi:phosphatidate cytidylyltransferase